MAKNRTIQKISLSAAGILCWPGHAWGLGDAAGRYQRYDAALHTVFGGIAPGLLFAIITALFLALAALPFLPGIIELYRRFDGLLQNVDAEYVKDPRYFERSFVRIFTRSIGTPMTSGTRQIRLGRQQESVEFFDTLNVRDDGVFDSLMYVLGNVKAGANVAFMREAYVRGTLSAGPAGMFRAVAATGNLTFGPRTDILRWAGTDGSITIDDDSMLGNRISCDGELDLGSRCSFKYLSGNPIMTRPEEAVAQAAAETAGSIEDTTFYVSKGQVSIPRGSVIANDIVVKSGLTIQAQSAIIGTITVSGDLVIEKNVTIKGNIFCEGDIRIGETCNLMGAVFCLRGVSIGAGTIVGAPDGYRSVIARRWIELGPGVTVYGQVMTEGTGRTL